MERISNLLLIIIFLFGCGREEDQLNIEENDWTTKAFTFEFDGLDRSYILHKPKNFDKNSPLVFMLHGFGSSSMNIMSYSQMNLIADQNGFIQHFHKNVKDNLVVLCKKCHDLVHHGNLEIKGWIETAEGKKLDFTYLQTKPKSKKKFNENEIEKIIEFKEYKKSIAINILKNDHNIVISQGTLTKIWKGEY